MTGTDSSWFSLVGFAVALVTVGVGTAAGLAFVPVVGSTYVGTLVGGLVAGLVVEDRPLAEAGVAGVLAGLGVLVAGPFVGNGIVEAVLALGSIAPGTLLVSAALSFAVGAFGAHFGDDLRDGLTDPVEESASRRTASGSAGDRLAATGSSDVGQEVPESADGRSEAVEAPDVEQKASEPANRGSDAPESSDVELEGPE